MRERLDRTMKKFQDSLMKGGVRMREILERISSVTKKFWKKKLAKKEQLKKGVVVQGGKMPLRYFTSREEREAYHQAKIAYEQAKVKVKEEREKLIEAVKEDYDGVKGDLEGIRTILRQRGKSEKEISEDKEVKRLEVLLREKERRLTEEEIERTTRVLKRTVEEKERNLSEKEKVYQDKKDLVLDRWICWGMLFLIAAIISFSFWWTANPSSGHWNPITILDHKLKSNLLIRWTVFFLAVGYLIASIRILKAYEIGAKVLLGRPLTSIGPGPHFTPRFVLDIVRLDRRIIEIEYPSPKEYMEHPETKEKVPVTPLRLISGSFEEVSEEEREKIKTKEVTPLDRRLVSSAKLIFQFRIVDAKTLIMNIELPVAEASITDFIVQHTQEVWAQQTTAKSLTMLAEIKRDLTEGLQEMTRPWGVQLVMAAIKEVTTPRRINVELAEVGVKTALGQQMKTIAEAERFKREKEGRGTAAAYKAIGEATDPSESGRMLLLGQELVKLAGSTQTTLLTGAAGIADLFGTVGAIQDLLKTRWGIKLPQEPEKLKKLIKELTPKQREAIRGLL